MQKSNSTWYLNSSAFWAAKVPCVSLHILVNNLPGLGLFYRLNNSTVHSSPHAFFYCFSLESSETKVMTISPYFEVSINILHSVGFLVDFPSRSRKATFSLDGRKKKKPVKNVCSGGSVQSMKKRWGIQVLAAFQELRPNIATKESRQGRNIESLSLRKYFQKGQGLSVSEQKTPWRVGIYA